ncbi:MAG TPA: hypothetical protein VGI87_11245 [Solirubrobacteraceae bacterium]|jgi:hypothetical protein
MLQVGIALIALIGFVAARRHRRGHLPAQAVIVSPRKSTAVARDGAVYSGQSAELTMARTDLEHLWTPANLEKLARTYWRFLSRVTLGLIRVIYSEKDRRVVFLFRPLTLLRFEVPEYSFAGDEAQVRWRIRGGLLVARAGRGSGYLTLTVKREPDLTPDGRAKVRIDVEVANFYPAIAAGFSTPVYEATQSAIHVLVTHAFLRSLAALDLAESKVGTLAHAVADAVVAETTAPAAESESEPEPVKTP